MVGRVTSSNLGANWLKGYGFRLRRGMASAGLKSRLKRYGTTLLREFIGLVENMVLPPVFTLETI